MNNHCCHWLVAKVDIIDREVMLFNLDISSMLAWYQELNAECLEVLFLYLLSISRLYDTLLELIVSYGSRKFTPFSICRIDDGTVPQQHHR